VLLLAAILGIGLLLGWGFGGRLRNIATVRIRLWPLAIGALVLQSLPIPPLRGSVGELVPIGVLLASFGVLLFVAAANWRLRGFVLILLGLLLNAVVITVNQGMPVSENAVRQSGQAAGLERLASGDDPKHHLADENDVLLPLADVIPVGSPFNQVLSIGDVAAYVGAAAFLTAAMLGLAERRMHSPGRLPTERARTSETRR
jgi:hypothetical protein